MRKTLDRMFDLSDEGQSARFRLQLFEPCPEDGEENSNARERVVITSWFLDQPGLPLDSWASRMADETFALLERHVPDGQPVLLVEFYAERQYAVGGNQITLSEAITIARLEHQPDGSFALWDFGEMAREEIENRIGEPLPDCRTGKEATTTV